MVGEGFGWSLELVLDVFVARIIDLYARRRNTLAILSFPSPDDGLLRALGKFFW